MTAPSLPQITRTLAALPTATLAAAHALYIAGTVPVDKTTILGNLARAVSSGTVTVDQVYACHGAAVVHPSRVPSAAPVASAAPATVLRGALGAPVPAFTPDPRIESAASAAARSESVALDAKTRAEQAERAAAMLQDRLRVMGEEVAAIRKEAAAAAEVKASPNTIAAAVRGQVEKAFGPIREAAKTDKTIAIKVKDAVSSGPIGTADASSLFGIEVNDLKGNPLTFDVYNHADAAPVDPNHIWTESVIRVLYLAQKLGANVWLGGEKGTGKTQTVQQFAARTGRSFTRINFHQFSTAEEFIGAKGLENGKTEFKPEAFLLGFTRPGHVVLLDEPTNCSPGELATLNGLLEPSGRVTLGDKVWNRAPGALVFGADNTLGNGDQSGRYAGTRQMNAALMDRFALKVPFSFLPLQQEIDAVVKHTGCSADLAAEVMRVITTARGKVQTGEVIDAPSIRQVMAWIHAMPVLGVRGAWDATVASSQPAESAIGLEAVYTAEVNESAILKHL